MTEQESGWEVKTYTGNDTIHCGGTRRIRK